jgi:hypothetical protein
MATRLNVSLKRSGACIPAALPKPRFEAIEGEARAKGWAGPTIAVLSRQVRIVTGLPRAGLRFPSGGFGRYSSSTPSDPAEIFDAPAFHVVHGKNGRRMLLCHRVPYPVLPTHTHQGPRWPERRRPNHQMNPLCHLPNTLEPKHRCAVAPHLPPAPAIMSPHCWRSSLVFRSAPHPARL